MWIRRDDPHSKMKTWIKRDDPHSKANNVDQKKDRVIKRHEKVKWGDNHKIHISRLKRESQQKIHILILLNFKEVERSATLRDGIIF